VLMYGVPSETLIFKTYDLFIYASVILELISLVMIMT
jgi:hypothetical protein